MKNDLKPIYKKFVLMIGINWKSGYKYQCINQKITKTSNQLK